MSTENLLKKINNLFSSGRIEQAKALAGERRTKSEKDASLHLKWADILEELGLINDLVQELNFAIRDDPENDENYLRLAEIYLDQGNADRAARCMWGLVKKDPSNAGYYKEVGRILEEGRQFEKAVKVYKKGFEKTGDKSFNAMIRSLDFMEPDEQDTNIESGDQIIPSKQSLVTFTSLFSGREGVYARQWASPTGETGYTPVKEPLTVKVAENHILGNFTAGVYPVRIDNTVNFIAFDLDLPKFIINKAISRESLWKKAMGKVHRMACRLVDLGAANDIPVYIENSGFKGRHCWIFLDTPVPAGVAKKFGTVFLNRLDKRTPEVSIEVFPKQGFVKKGSLGNLIKLPLGFHKKTGKRGLFISPDDMPRENQLEFLETIVKTDRKIIFSIMIGDVMIGDVRAERSQL